MTQEGASPGLSSACSVTFTEWRLGSYKTAENTDWRRVTGRPER